jgi:exodeoxyribonuclease V alpha subunit
MSLPALSLGNVSRVAGRVSLRGEVLAELRRSVTDDELGATVRVRLQDGSEAVWSGPDVPQRQVGSVLHASGYWDAHATRGAIFRVEDLRGIERPREAHATAQYLVANIEGLGRKRAAKLVAALGPGALDRLIESPAIAAAVIPGGAGLAVSAAIERWAGEQRRDGAARILTTRLTAAGVSYGVVRRIVRFFSSADAAAVATLRHPYRLIAVPRIGWETADRIAQRLGVAEDDPRRLLAACEVTLAGAPPRGHTALPHDEIVRGARRLVGRHHSVALVDNAAQRLVADGHAVAVDDLLGLPELVAAEADLADSIAGVIVGARPLSLEQADTVDAVLARSALAPSQQAAVRVALGEGCSVVTGRPGAGKTTTMKVVVAAAQALGWRVQVAAPTGKAASRAAAVTGAPASTVHRLLAGQPLDAPAPLQHDLIVVDEASMCDVTTSAWLMRAVDARRGCRVVWCGDADQLPSVGAGQVLSDLIASGVIATARLTQVFRQAAGSPIVQNAHRLLDGAPLDTDLGPGWRWVPAAASPDAAALQVLGEVRELLVAGWGPGQVQVLSPMRRGPLGVELLNARLQQIINPSGSLGPFVGGGMRARVGDRVVVTRNIYELATPVFNGEQGVVVEADRRGVLLVDLGDRVVTLTGVHCLMVRLAWAMTVHRSQGSEYPAVVMAYDHRAHRPMLDRRVLYTGITRARDHLTLVSTDAAIAGSYAGSSATDRHTTLRHHVAGLIPYVRRTT